MRKSFYLEGPFANEIMDEVNRNVGTRGYSDRELGDVAKPVAYDIVDDYHYYDFTMLRQMASNDDINNISGKGVKHLIKKAMFRAFRWYLVPMLNNQIEFRLKLIDEMELMCAEIDYLRSELQRRTDACRYEANGI